MIVIADDSDPVSRWEIVAIPPIPLKPLEDVRVVVVDAIRADSVVLRHCDQMYGIYCWSVKSFFDADERKALGRVETRPLGESSLLRLNGSIYTVTKRLWNRRSWHEAIVARYSPGQPMLVAGAERSEVIASLPTLRGDCDDPEEDPILEGGLLDPGVTPLTRPNCFVQVASSPPLWTFGFHIGDYVPRGPFKFMTGIAIRNEGSFQAYPLPQSTPEELGRYRPLFQKYAQDMNSYRINESIEAFAPPSDRLWFGKTFYDGEGYTGVGSLGYFDISRRDYTLIRPPELSDWSTSAILVEGESIWVALTHYTEGASSSGGLLRYDKETGATRIHPITDVITDMLGHNGSIYVSTERGRTYVLKDDSIVSRFAVEPALDGGFEIRSFSNAQ